MAPQLPVLWIWKGQSLAGCLNWPLVQSWSYSLVTAKRTKEDFLLLDSSGQCWRLVDISPQNPVRGLRRFFFVVAQVWRSPSVKVNLKIEPITLSLEAVKEEILKQVTRDDDVLTQFVKIDKLEQAVRNSKSAVELIHCLRRLKAVQFHSIG